MVAVPIVGKRAIFACTPLRNRAYAARSLCENPKKFHRTGRINIRERYDSGKLETFCFASVLFVLRRIIKSIVPILAASFSLFSCNSGNPSIFEIPGPRPSLPMRSSLSLSRVRRIARAVSRGVLAMVTVVTPSFAGLWKVCIGSRALPESRPQVCCRCSPKFYL